MSHCCLCGLLCSLDRAATDACPRRSDWLKQTAAQQSNYPGSHEPLTPAELAAQIETIAAHFHPSRRSLIWIDGADVHTLRSAVKLTMAVGGTIHVGQSTGGAASHRVLTSQGWLGSSLAEVASHADLIISLGSCLRTEAPLLAQRFISPALASGRAQWCYIDSHAVAPDTAAPDAATPQTGNHPTPNWTVDWPRSKWYEQLTQIMLGLQDESACAESMAGRISESTHELLGKLRGAKNTVWIWDVDEFCDAIDELIISRLLGIGRLLSQTARCGMLALDAQVGRVTASETLLWLTGCSGTAQFDGQHWRQPPTLAETPLEDWPNLFDSIVVVRSLPSVYPLPNLQASHFIVPDGSLLPDHIADTRVSVVSSVGIESAGHVMRGDRATMMYCQANAALARPMPTTPKRSTAAELLEQVLRRVQLEGEFDAN